jgi:hypothetical protein
MTEDAGQLADICLKGVQGVALLGAAALAATLLTHEHIAALHQKGNDT